jgi:hypothetical protein
MICITLHVRLITTEPNPRIVARGQKYSPTEKEYEKEILKESQQGIIEPSPRFVQMPFWLEKTVKSGW